MFNEITLKTVHEDKDGDPYRKRIITMNGVQPIENLH